MYPFKIEDIALDYKNILLKHKKCIVSSRSECNITTEIAGKKVKCPVFPSNMPAVINQDICKIFDDAGWFHIYHRLGGDEDILSYVKRANEEKWNFVSISIGIKEQDCQLLKKIDDLGYRLDSINIDVALSWQDNVGKMIKYIKQHFTNVYLIVGAGDNPEWIRWLDNLEVNCARVGLGLSSVCRTAQFTGFKTSTISDLAKCSGIANNIKIASDGGLTNRDGEVWIGDVAKSIRFGADFICSGSLFSRCIDSPSFKLGYYGNASRKAKGNNHVEGACMNVDTNGLTIKETIKLIEESLKSSCSYAGGNKLEDLRNVDYQIVF